MQPAAAFDLAPPTRAAAHLRSTTFAFQAMGSEGEIRLDGADDAAVGTAAQAAIAEVRRIEQAYSRYRPDSIVSRINAAAGNAGAVEVDAETAGLLDFAERLHRLSEGLFDITSGVLRRAWDFRAGCLPAPGLLAELLPLIGWQRVAWHDGCIRLPRAGMELDFGGFGKEYAADRAMAVLAAAGQRHGFVNLGGDIRVLGPRADGSPWRFAIRHPRRDDAIVATVDLAAGALATSGDYERYFLHDGRRYCHVLDPRSGWPVSTWASVSVIAPVCTAAGALSTIAMLKGGDAPEFLATQGASALVLDTALHAIQLGPAGRRCFRLGAPA